MKYRVALATAALGVVALIGLSACGGATDTSSLGPEASALTSLGFSTDDVVTADSGSTGAVVPAADPSASPSASTGQHPRLRGLALRRRLGRNVEHGEVVVKTKNGDKTIDIQRGTVTAISATGVTVKSADGFTESWTFGNPIHVIENRTSVQPSAVTTGEEIGIAGAKNGGTVTATLIVIPHGK